MEIPPRIPSRWRGAGRSQLVARAPHQSSWAGHPSWGRGWCSSVRDLGRTVACRSSGRSRRHLLGGARLCGCRVRGSPPGCNTRMSLTPFAHGRSHPHWCAGLKACWRRLPLGAVWARQNAPRSQCPRMGTHLCAVEALAFHCWARIGPLF